MQQLFNYKIPSETITVFSYLSVIIQSNTCPEPSRQLCEDHCFQFSLTIYCQAPKKDWPPCLSIRMARIHQFLVSFIVLIPATHEKLSHVTHLERELFFPLKFASICQERLQAIPITSKFLHYSSGSQMSYILLGLLVFY